MSELNTRIKAVNIAARKLPEGAKIHPEFGIMEYTSESALRSKFGPAKFDGLEDRDLKIVLAASVGAYYEYEREPQDVRHGFYVVISSPKVSKE